MSENIEVVKNSIEIESVKEDIKQLRIESKDADKRHEGRMTRIEGMIHKLYYGGTVGILLILFKNAILDLIK